MAARHAAALATSDGTKYTLNYLDQSTRFSVWRGSGERSSFSEMLAAAEVQDVVVLGETHHDAVAHKLQEIVFARLAARRDAALSLEMFEADVQHVLDEYMAGLTREEDMLRDGRPWANYREAYRSLVELARAAALPVIAANAPRRYVSAVGRDGHDALSSSRAWGPQAYAALPPLPLPPPSEGYVARLMADPEVVPRTMSKGAEESDRPVGRCPYIGLNRRDGLMAPMLLWDAAMAHAIATALSAGPDSPGSAPQRPGLAGWSRAREWGGGRVGAARTVRGCPWSRATLPIA